jgi:asparagine synthase (glutamine-hydrolysing)
MALDKQAWRGPDGKRVEVYKGGVWMGHLRLAIVHPTDDASQPMTTSSGRHSIIFNGEIYNHIALRQKFDLSCATSSDTETILVGFETYGERFLSHIDGMFALVIFDHETQDVWAIRDFFGIKPLYVYKKGNALIYSSETVSIRGLVPCDVDDKSIDEWRLIRRPMPGRSFFQNIDEVEPGVVYLNGVEKARLRVLSQSSEKYSEDIVGTILRSSVKAHEMSDVGNVSLLSGGIDSSLIAAYSEIGKCYSVGVDNNNEFAVAKQSSKMLEKELQCVTVPSEDLVEVYRRLIQMKGEPLSLPNEGLIFCVCASMEPNEKVVLTGEGADEIFFGYDGIFRWASELSELNIPDFLERYGYSDIEYLTERMHDDLRRLMKSKTPIEFVEDFFFKYHLPCLLRRMDFAAMAASKEARVPFVSRALVEYMYRRPSNIKIDEVQSKKPLRGLLADLNFTHVLKTKKIGFSAKVNQGDSRTDEYQKFQELNMEELGW